MDGPALADHAVMVIPKLESERLGPDPRGDWYGAGDICPIGLDS